MDLMALKEYKTSRWRLAVGVVVLIAAALFLRQSPGLLSPTALRAWIQGYGMAAPLAYMLAYLVLVVLFFPASVLSAVGGILFGTIFGAVYTVLAATAAAVAAFLLARGLGREFVAARLGSKLQKWESTLIGDGNGFWAMVTLRLLFLPYIPLSYAAGLTSMTLWDFAWATFLTNIPDSFAFTYVGASLFDQKNLISAVAYIALVMCIPFVVKQWQKRKRAQTS